MPPLGYALPGAEAMLAQLAQAWPLEPGALSVHRFPDGESLVRLQTPPAGRDVVVCACLRDPDPQLFALLCAAATARELGARSVGLIAPYLPYLRQDRRFHEGEALSNRQLARLVGGAFEWLVAADPHLHRVHALGDLFEIPARAVSAGEAMSRWIAAQVRAPLVVGPDAESEQWASVVARGAGAPCVVLQKQRHGDRDVTITLPDIERWRGHTPVLIDDIISSGHTLMQAVRQLRAQGLQAPVCLATHAVFADRAYDELLAAGAAAVVTADSIPHPSNRLALAPALAAAGRALLAL